MKQRRLLIFFLAFALAAALSAQAFAATPKMLVPVGEAVGIRIRTDGIVITGFDESAPAQDAGLRTGDVIQSVNGVELASAADLAEVVRDCCGQPLTVSALRKGKPFETAVTPDAVDGGWRMGIYIRDAVAGIGTVTWYDPQTGSYGALGHGINDSSAGGLIPLAGGELLPAQIVGVNRGQRGAPGQLQGAFLTESLIGSVERNTSCGIFGQLTGICTQPAIPVAAEEDIRPGAATIRCMVDADTVREYAVQIEKVDTHGKDGRDMILKVTDPELLAITGGIVQGMSGSPIIQDGKLVGAVTHVLVNDPTRGYGIFIENMLGAAG